MPSLALVVEYGSDEEYRQEVYRVSSSDDKGRMTEEQMKEAGEGKPNNKLYLHIYRVSQIDVYSHWNLILQQRNETEIQFVLFYSLNFLKPLSATVHCQQ